jgi:hypothetical protein
VRKSDEGFSNMLDKQMLNQLVNENVIILTQNKIQKPQGLYEFWGFFYLKQLYYIKSEDTLLLY